MIIDDFTDQELCPFLSKTNGSIFQEPMDEVLWRVVRCHLRCLCVSESEYAAMKTKSWVLFHVTFYEILDPDMEMTLTELWPCGDLHSDLQQKGKPRKIRESALTVSIFCLCRL